MTNGDDFLSQDRGAIIVWFMANHNFDMAEFLSRVIRDYAFGGKKELLAYPCMIIQLCLATRVLEFPGIDEIL